MFILDPVLRSDSLDYQTLAMSLLRGEYFLNGKPTAYVSIGYPAFLSGVIYLAGEGQFYIRLVQSVLDTCSALIFFGISRKFLTVRNSLISAALFSLLPSNILYSQTILSEPLFGFFSMAVLYLLLNEKFSESSRYVFFTGLIFGCSVLIRPAYLPVFFLIPLYFFYVRKKTHEVNKNSSALKYILFFSAGMLLVLAPWSIRNKIMVGTFSPGTTSGINFWAGSNPAATGTYYLKPDENLPADYSNEAERDKQYFKLGLDYALSHPLNYLLLGIKKTGYLFSSERMIVIYFLESPPGKTSTEIYRTAEPWFTLLVNIPYFIIMILGTWGLMLLRKNRFFIYGSVITWIITVSLFIALSRYHYVLIPFFILGSVMLIQTGKGFLKEISTAGKIIAALVSLFLLTAWSVEFYLLLK
ncbi:MAG: glycosyltransferase family 39 protein [Bacteroidetes bacterium]|nr:glycosyltransferase family 39 protein [Bacteroidota bacterium]